LTAAVNDHDALNPRLSGLGWKPLGALADRFGRRRLG
jgi:hypothetical protein